MAAKKDAATELADKMLRVLESQRALGSDAYPTTLRRLAELTDPSADPQTVQKAVKKKTFAGRTVAVQAKNLDGPVVLAEDTDQLAASTGLLNYLLESLCTAAKPTVEVSALKKKAPVSVREPFGSSLDRRIADNALPPGMTVIKMKNKLHLHLQRYPLPRKPEEVLAEELVRSLQSQRQLGTAAYPTTLAHLIGLTRSGVEDALLKKAMTHAIFKEAVVLAMSKSGRETLIALAGDLQSLADSPLLLAMALRQARTETKQAFAPAKLKTQVVPKLRKAFEEAIKRRATEGHLPRGVGRLLQDKKPLLFLISDIVSGKSESDRAEPPQTSPTVSERKMEFAHAFDEAFRRLDEQSRSHNFVSLLDLRRALPFAPKTFDEGLHELRRTRRYTLSAAEGRQGISPEEQEAGIIEDGALLLYVSRKLS